MPDFVKKLFFYGSILVLHVQRFFFLIPSPGAAVPSRRTACGERGQDGPPPALQPLPSPPPTSPREICFLRDVFIPPRVDSS